MMCVLRISSKYQISLISVFKVTKRIATYVFMELIIALLFAYWIVLSALLISYRHAPAPTPPKKQKNFAGMQ